MNVTPRVRLDHRTLSTVSSLSEYHFIHFDFLNKAAEFFINRYMKSVFLLEILRERKRKLVRLIGIYVGRKMGILKYVSQ